MNAPFRLEPPQVREAGPADSAAYARFLAGESGASVFHEPAWLDAISAASGHATRLLLAEQAGVIVAALPLHAVSSLLFGRALVSTGFAVGGGSSAIRRQRPRWHRPRRPSHQACAARPSNCAAAFCPKRPAGT
jgi:CelD/BcsL family acetyltransferase involved in cellulose biosynthesis